MKRLAKRLLLVAAIGLVAVAAFLATHPTTRYLLRHAREPDEVVVPVAGVAPRSVSSSFGEPRSGHRRHRGVDIFARRGTPVVAATAGRVVRIGTDRLGGNVVWVAGEGAKMYYYAHLDRFRDRLARGEEIARGDVLGSVGTTGNAAGTSPHLHFGIYPLKHGFVAVDPAPILRRQGRTLRR